MADDTNAQERPIVTRAEAKTAGAKRYFTGKPCKRGHVEERWLITYHCLECHRGQPRGEAYIAKHLAKENARYAANPEKVRAIRRAKYAEDPDKFRALSVADRAANPTKGITYAANARARKRQAGGTHTTSDIETLMKLQRGKCAHPWCKKELSRGYHRDHILPLAKGGSNSRRNIQLLCPRCNLSKNAIHPIDFAQRNGMLL